MARTQPRRKRAARQGKMRPLLAAKQEREHHARVGTFTSAQSGTVRVTHKEPLLDEAFAIQRQRNMEAAEGPTDAGTRLEQIKQELAHRHRIQRLNALEIGRLYYEAKRLLPHGEFSDWVKRVGLYAHSAVVAYMRIYRLCFGRPELVEAIKPTCFQVICAPSFPEDLREEIFVSGGYNGTVEQLKDLAKKVRAQKLSPKSKAVRALLRDLDNDSLKGAMEDVLGHLQAQVRHARQELEKLVSVGGDGASAVGVVPVIQRRIRQCEAFEVQLT